MKNSKYHDYILTNFGWLSNVTTQGDFHQIPNLSGFAISF